MQKRTVKAKRRAVVKVTAGSKNVFADLGLANAEELLVKAEFARYINLVIERKGLTQVEAAKLLGVHQPKVSALKRGRLTEFSLETLLRFLVTLGLAVDINVHVGQKAGLRVMCAGS